MSVVKLKEVDEVWVALEQAYGSLQRDGHKPMGDKLNCWNCYVMWLIGNAMAVYKERVAETSGG